MKKVWLILLFRNPRFYVPLAVWLDQRWLQIAVQVNLSLPWCGKSNGILWFWNGASLLAISWARAKLKSQPQPKSAPSLLPARARPPRAPETALNVESSSHWCEIHSVTPDFHTKSNSREKPFFLCWPAGWGFAQPSTKLVNKIPNRCGGLNRTYTKGACCYPEGRTCSP